MNVIKLIVTGKCEHLALHNSLKRQFPDAQFARPSLKDSFTSAPLGDPAPLGVVALIDKFAQTIIAEVEDSDALVIAVDDLELANKGNEDQVAAAVRRAIEKAVAAYPLQRRQRVADKLRSRASFHLLSPMVEAYFFGEPAALKRAGALRESKFNSAAHDVEAFCVEDPAFSAPSDSGDSTDWCHGGEARVRHPKRYLKFLTSDGSPGSGRYKETTDGRAALDLLDWPQVVANSQFARCARALLNDIADFLQLEQRSAGAEATATSLTTHRNPHVLRNL